MEVQDLHSNYVFITSLLKKERALYPEIVDRCRDLQGQLIPMLTQFVIEVDALKQNTDVADCKNQALLLCHIRMMSEVNGCIYTFLNTPNSAGRSVFWNQATG